MAGRSEAFRIRLCGLLLLLAALLAWSNSFSCPFIFDDLYAISGNPAMGVLYPPTAASDAVPGSTIGSRPVSGFSLSLNHRLFGPGVTSFHAVNLAIHIATGLLLFGILRRTLKRQTNPDFANASTALAVSAALLWVVHPLHTSAVTYMVQRCESMMGMFLALTLYCCIRGWESDRPRRWFAAAIAACGLGMGC
jgi:hypothetical protein